MVVKLLIFQTPVLVCALLIAGHCSMYGQPKPISSVEFARIQKHAEELLKTAPSIQESIEERVDQKTGQFAFWAKRRREVVPPDRERITAEVLNSGVRRKYVGIRIAETLYTKAEGGDWQTMPDPKEFGGPIPGATSVSSYSFEGMESVSGIEARVYKVRNNSRYGSGKNESINSSETTYWFDSSDRYLRTSKDSSNNSKGRVKVTTTFGYPTILLIEAPIK